MLPDSKSMSQDHPESETYLKAAIGLHLNSWRLHPYAVRLYFDPFSL